MLDDRTHDQLGDAATAMLRYDEHVSQIGKCRKIRNNPGKANLPPSRKCTKAK